MEDTVRGVTPIHGALPGSMRDRSMSNDVAPNIVQSPPATNRMPAPLPSGQRTDPTSPPWNAPKPECPEMYWTPKV